MLDLIPLDLEETEKFVFRHKRIPLHKLNVSFQFALMNAIEHKVATIALGLSGLEVNYQRALDQALEEFNQNKIKQYAKVLGTVKAGCQLNLSEPITYSAWIDYWEISQEECDYYPKYLTNQIYAKYLGVSLEDGASIQRKIEGLVTREAQAFKGKLLNQANLDALKDNIRNTLQSVADKIDISCPNLNQINIKSTSGVFTVLTQLSIN